MNTNRQDLLLKLKKLYDINTDEIKDISDGRVSISLHEIRYEIKKLSELIPEHYLEDIVRILPDGEINNINNNIIRYIDDVLNKVKNLTPNTHNIHQVVQGLINQLKSYIHTLIVTLGKYKAIINDKFLETRFSELSNRINEQLSETKELTSKVSFEIEEKFKELSSYIDQKLEKISEYEKEIEERKSKFDRLAEEVQKLSAETSVEKFADIFKKEANKYRNLAIGFGIISSLLLVGNILIGKMFYDELIMLIEKNGNITASQLFAGNLLRIFVISIGIYALLYFVKLVNINMHLYVLNTHRHNALRTFRTFIDSVDDKYVKEQLTNIVAKYIFDTHSTGYIKNDSSKTSDSNIIFSLIEKGADRINK